MLTSDERGSLTYFRNKKITSRTEEVKCSTSQSPLITVVNDGNNERLFCHEQVSHMSHNLAFKLIYFCAEVATDKWQLMHC